MKKKLIQLKNFLFVLNIYLLSQSSAIADDWSAFLNAHPKSFFVISWNEDRVKNGVKINMHREFGFNILDENTVRRIYRNTDNNNGYDLGSGDYEVSKDGNNLPEGIEKFYFNTNKFERKLFNYNGEVIDRFIVEISGDRCIAKFLYVYQRQSKDYFNFLKDYSCAIVKADQKTNSKKIFETAKIITSQNKLTLDNDQNEININNKNINYKSMNNEYICRYALNANHTEYENSYFVGYVNEAKKRGLNVLRCMYILDGLDKLSDSEICNKAIDDKAQGFHEVKYQNYVYESRNRGYTEERCLKLIGREKNQTIKLTDYNESLEQIKTFVSSNKPSTDPIKFAVAVDKLRKAVAGTDDAAKRDAYDQLNKILDVDQNYIAFKKKKDEETRQADNETLRKLNSDAKIIKAFIADYLNKNPIAEHAADLGEIISVLDNQIKYQNIYLFKSSMESVTNKLQEYKLSANFQKYKLDNETEIKNVELSVDAPIASQILKLTSNNKILLEGSKDDIVILYNTTKDAPNVATNLAGRLTFEKDQAYICWYQAKPSDEEHKRQALQELNKLGALKVSDPKLSCEPASLQKKYDIIMLERGLFLSSSIDFALLLNDKVEKGEFKLASLLKGDDIISEIQKHETLAQLVETEVEKDLRTGFGIVRIGNDNRVICAAISDHQDGHRKLLNGKTSEISDQLGGRGSILELSMEQAFISAKKNQCGIIYSSASDMKSLYPALKRESIPYKTLPIWFSLKEIEEADKAFKNEQTAALQSEEQTRQKLADEAQLKEASENTAEALRKKKENQLRSTYAVTAKALSDEVGKKILDDVSKLTANNQENQKPNYLSMFRDLSSWYQKRLNEQWELADSRFELYDYGTSRWNDRRIDTVFDKVTIKIKNRAIGKYDERCVIIGLVVDKEFEMYREPFESSCENVENSLENWMKARSFEERWIVRK